MAVKIRLTRMGDKKSPFYRIVVTDSRKARDGAYIEKLGTFNPLTDPAEITLDVDRTKTWLSNLGKDCSAVVPPIPAFIMFTGI